jgi:hypothetical protein
MIWSDLLSRVNVRPLASRSFSSVSSQWLGDDHQLLYVQCNTLRGDGLADGSGAVAMELMSIVETQLLPHRPKNVVFDLRQNGGGNLFNAVMFSQAVPHVIAKGGKVYVLIGPKSFSAAIATAAMLKGAGGDQIIIAGRTVGDTLKFWAEGRPFILPNSKLKVGVSTKLHDWSEGCVNTEHCFWGNAAYASKNVSLEPEITVTENFEDYASGRDRLLEQIVFLANSDQQGLDQ